MVVFDRTHLMELKEMLPRHDILSLGRRENPLECVQTESIGLYR